MDRICKYELYHTYENCISDTVSLYWHDMRARISASKVSVGNPRSTSRKSPVPKIVVSSFHFKSIYSAFLGTGWLSLTILTDYSSYLGIYITITMLLPTTLLSENRTKLPGTAEVPTFHDSPSLRWASRRSVVRGPERLLTSKSVQHVSVKWKAKERCFKK